MKVNEIICEFLDSWQGTEEFKLALLEHLKGKMPERKKIDKTVVGWGEKNEKATHFNQAISDCIEVLEKELG